MKIARIGLFFNYERKITELIIIHDISNGMCTVEHEHGNLSHVSVDNIQLAPFGMKGINPEYGIKEYAIKDFIERVGIINGDK